jgi:hypothetical protein
LGEPDPADNDARGEGGQEPARRLTVEEHEHATIGRATDQPTESLPEPEPGDAIVEALRVATGEVGTAFAMQDVGPWPGHLLEHDEPERPARYVHPVAHRVRAEQAALLLGTEYID